MARLLLEAEATLDPAVPAHALQDSAPEPCAYVETGAAPYPTTNLASNALYEEQA